MARPKVENPETRARILAAAERRFAEQGFDGSAIRQVAEDAGVNTALVHYYFGTKESLYRSVLMGAAADLATLSFEALGVEGSATAQLARFVEGFSRMFAAHPDRPKLMQRELLSGAGRIRELLDGRQPPHVEALRQILARGIREGEFREVDVDLASISLLGMIVVFQVGRPILPTVLGIERYDDAFVDRLVEHTVGLFLDGARPRSSERRR